MFIKKILKGIAALIGGILFTIGCLVACGVALICALPLTLIGILLFAGAKLLDAAGVDFLDPAIDTAMEDLKSGIEEVKEIK